MNRFYVYCHTSPSGRKYVGWTGKTVNQRWQGHVCSAFGGETWAISKSIRKYGPESFTREILEVMSTEAGAKRAEQLWIKQLNTKVPNGYNMTDGGEGITGFKQSAETISKIISSQVGRKFTEDHKTKLSEAHKGIPNNWLGRNHSEQGCINIGNAIRGRKWSGAQRKKLSDFRRGKPKTDRQRKLTDSDVDNIRTLCKNGISQADVARQYNVRSNTISRIVNFKRRYLPLPVITDKDSKE